MYNREKFNPTESENVIEKHAEEILENIGLLSEDFNAESIPVDKTCRVNMENFINVHLPEEISRDCKYIEKVEKEYARRDGLTIEEWKKSKDFRDGERFEQLKTIIFNKNFRNEDIIAVRASKYDDYKNNIDNIIINKKNGAIICALDEITADKNSKIYKEKEKKVKEINERGGAELKYGITFKDDGAGPRPVLKEIKKINIFILSLSPYELREAIENFGNSKFENKLFREKFGKQAIEQLQKLPSFVPQSLKEQWMNCF